MRGRFCVADSDGLSHQRIYDGLIALIESGAVPLGGLVPSTTELEKQYKVSKTPVRTAIERLQAEGILKGHPGKGNELIALPRSASRTTLGELAEDVEKLGSELRELADRVHAASPERELTTEVAELRALVEQLYNRLGHPLPDDQTTATKRRATGT